MWKGLEESWLHARFSLSLEGYPLGEDCNSQFMSEGTEAHGVEDFVPGHTEINNGPGIWSWVGLIPKDHGFPTVHFLDICTDCVPHFTHLYPTEPTPVDSSCVVPQTLRLCPPELIVYSIHQFCWSIFMSQPGGMTHSFFPFIFFLASLLVSWWARTLVEIAIPQWGTGFESSCLKAGTTVSVIHSVLAFVILVMASLFTDFGLRADMPSKFIGWTQINGLPWAHQPSVPLQLRFVAPPTSFRGSLYRSLSWQFRTQRIQR